MGLQVLVIGLALAISLLMPSRYAALAAVLVDIKSPDPVANTTISPQMLTPLMANETSILQSEKVMLKAIQDVHLDRDEALKARWESETKGQGDYLIWLATAMERDLEIKPARDGTVLGVQFTARDRDMAAQMANAVVKAYMDTSLSLRVDPAEKFTSFFDDRVKAARTTLETAQAKLSAAQQAKGIIGNDDRFDIENARLMDLSSQMTTLQAQVAESASRQRESSRRADLAPEVQASPVLIQLNSLLAQQQARLIELSARLSENHPQIIELKSTIAQTQASIASASEKIARGLAIPNEINRARLDEVSAALSAQRAKVIKLRGDRDSVSVLQRDVENSQRAYDDAVTKLNQSSLESKSRQTNLSVLKAASPPLRRSSPAIPLNLAVAVVLGAIISMVVVYVREISDRRMRSAEDIVSYLDQTLLGILPAAPRTIRPAPSLLLTAVGLSAQKGHGEAS